MGSDFASWVEERNPTIMRPICLHYYKLAKSRKTRHSIIPYAEQQKTAPTYLVFSMGCRNSER